MKVAIVGSRDFHFLEWVRDYVRELAAEHPEAVVISGGARGVDNTAAFTAAMCKLKVVTIPADWKTYGPRAGFLRNHEIVRQCDRLTAFWDHESRGTEHAIKCAEEAGKPVTILPPF